jgi:hypothetical protein
VSGEKKKEVKSAVAYYVYRRKEKRSGRRNSDKEKSEN